jgi:hypothetical protein
MPINSIYSALLILMMLPVVWYSLATSGIADNTVVLPMGDRKLQYEISATITRFREGVSRS